MCKFEQGAQPKGDMDCNTDVNAVDALRILRHVAGLDPNLPPGCDPIGGAGTPTPTPPNGKIAFWSDRDGNWEIYVMNADGTGQTRLTNNAAGDWSPVWSP